MKGDKQSLICPSQNSALCSKSSLNLESERLGLQAKAFITTQSFALTMFNHPPQRPSRTSETAPGIFQTLLP